MVFGGRFRIRRCNSKASYLPRQSRDKLNTTDPDHGSYKLTLTSNEDSIIHNSSTNYHDANDILSSATKNCANLPDILPMNAKIQQQQQQQQSVSSSPSSSSGSSPRYGSNNNIGPSSSSTTSSPSAMQSATTPHTAPAMISSCYPSSKSMFHFQSAATAVNRQNPSSPITQNNHGISNKITQSTVITSSNSSTITSPQSTNTATIFSNSGDPISPKFMSQSTIDLKKTHIIESNEVHTGKILSPAQSENNITSPPIKNRPQSPFSARRDLHKTEIVRKLSLEERDRNEGRLVRAELVNTTLSASPPSIKSSDERVIRKESLRENIEKITQLQSKLMSAHLIENGGERKLLGYTAKTIEVTAKQIIEKESSAKKELKFSPNVDRKQQLLTHSSSKLDSSMKSLTSVPSVEFSTQPLGPASPSSIITTTNATATPSVPASSSVSSLSEIDKISQMDTELDGLKLMQRTEIILRLNAPTSEAASQTDDTLETELSSRIKLTENQNSNDLCNRIIDNSKILKPRKKLQEEIDCDNLSHDLAKQLPPNDKLCQILSPKVYRTSSDYISDLYNLNLSAAAAAAAATTTTTVTPKSTIITTSSATTTKTKRDVGTSTPNNNHDKSVGCELIESSSSTSSSNNKRESKETSYLSESKMAVSSSETSDSNRNCRQQQHQHQQIIREIIVVNGNRSHEEGGGGEGGDGNERNCGIDSCDLIKKKEELVNRLTKKLEVLGNEQTIIGEETTANEQLGINIATKITEKVRPIDATKFRAYIDDVGHITMLLLSLSGRLAKAENMLRSINENQGEKKILELKRDRLLEQLEEAKHLKEDIDRRGAIVGKILEKHLTNEEFAEYDLFINMKAKLIVDSKEIADKLKLSEEQLSALKDTLMQSEC